MRSAALLFALALALALAPAPAGAAANAYVPLPIERLQQALHRASARAPGRVAMEIKDLTTGYTTAINANAAMPAASTIKIPVMVEVFRQLELGRFDLNTRVTLLARDRDWGSGWLCDAPVGSTYSVSHLLKLMITVSDNTAANMLIRLVGRGNVNAAMHELGLDHTELASYIYTQHYSIRRTLRTSPADMVRLLTLMARGELVDAWSSRAMIAILEDQQINTLLPEPLPEGIPIAHKTGSFDDTLDDVGIVYAHPAPYVIAVMTTDLPTLSAGRTFIHHISKLAFGDIERFAAWRAESGDLTVPQDVPLWGQAGGI